MQDERSETKGRRRAVIAIGGNALLRPEQLGGDEDFQGPADEIAGHLVGIIRRGWSILLVHGNGPQVGIELIRCEEASTKVPPFGLDLCVASTQGSIAALLETAVRNALHTEGIVDVPVASIVSLVEVDASHPAFQAPTKPIGPAYSRYRATQILEGMKRKGWALVEERGRGWRTVVPSPPPLEVLSNPAARTLLEAGFLVIGGGGGGVPVSRRGPGGSLERVEAVIDKDRTATLMARAVDAELLVFLTGVPWVELNYDTPFARRIDRLHPDEARRFLAQGHFPAGSMGPKIEAAAEFASGSRAAIITSAPMLEEALLGRAGTWITSTEPSEEE